jgi:hypothetical protein
MLFEFTICPASMEFVMHNLAYEGCLGIIVVINSEIFVPKRLRGDDRLQDGEDNVRRVETVS